MTFDNHLLAKGFTVFTWLISFQRVISIIVILRLKLKKNGAIYWL